MRTEQKRDGRKEFEMQAGDARCPQRLQSFPIFLKVNGRTALVVGNGAEALAKARLLNESTVIVRLVAPAPEADLAAFVIQSDIEHLVRPYDPKMLDGVSIVFAATGDAERDAGIVSDARARSIPANAVDRPELCDFYVPALVNRAPVSVAIGTEGAGPVFAQILRARIESMLSASTGPLARMARDYRATVDRLVPRGAGRRRFWHLFFEGAVARAVEAGETATARRLVSRLMRGKVETAGFVSLVGAGPGAIDLLTLRAQRALQEADVILHDRLVPEPVIAMGRREASRIAVGKRKGDHSVSQEAINAQLVSLAREGKRVVRLKSGDPLVYGRAGEEMAALDAAGIDYEIVPGITAALAAAAEARIPLSLRGVAGSIVFATGHDRHSRTLPGWAGLALGGSTVAVYMGRTVAARVAGQLRAAGLRADTPVAVVESATLAGQRIAAGTLDELSALPSSRSRQAPAIILIGEALRHAALDDAEPLSTAFQSVAA